VTVELSVDAVVLDIEGTTTPIAFVHDVLFGYARTHVSAFLAARGGDPAVRAALDGLAKEHAAETDPARPAAFAVEPFVHWLMDRDRKSPALKALQGMIWRRGYEDGRLRSEMFPDVAPAFARWRAAGIAIAIYSSGSVEAQELLFRYSVAGDLTKHIDSYFDTGVGPKREAASYARIARELAIEPARIAFVSDVGEELAACRDAGMRGVLSVRPGNQPVPPPLAASFPSVGGFDELSLESPRNRSAQPA
jgi:enolase-phosphatase E1